MYALPGSPISSMMAIWIFFIQEPSKIKHLTSTHTTQFFMPFKAIKHKEQARIPKHPNMYKEAYKTHHAPNIISPRRYAKQIRTKGGHNFF
jgi:hypothetical protein